MRKLIKYTYEMNKAYNSKEIVPRNASGFIFSYTPKIFFSSYLYIDNYIYKAQNRSKKINFLSLSFQNI